MDQLGQPAVLLIKCPFDDAAFLRSSSCLSFEGEGLGSAGQSRSIGVALGLVGIKLLGDTLHHLERIEGCRPSRVMQLNRRRFGKQRFLHCMDHKR